MRKFIAVLLFLLALLPDTYSIDRNWTLSNGESFNAEIVMIGDGKVRFRRKDGKQRTLPISKLEDKSIRFIYQKELNLADFTSQRSWTKRKISGKLHTLDSDRIYLKDKTGKAIRIRKSSLSDKDNEYLDSVLTKAEDKFNGAEDSESTEQEEKEKDVAKVADPAPVNNPDQDLFDQDQFNQDQFDQNQLNQNFEPPPKALVTGFIIGGILILLGINAVLYTLCLWGGKMITNCDTTFPILLLTSIVGAVISIIPIIGSFLPGPIQIGMIMLLSKTTFVDTLFMVVVGNLLFVVISIFAVAKMMGALA